MAINGWVGKILWVDLTSGDITEIPTTDYVPKFIGGRGVAAAIHFDNQGPEVGAFDPENLLFFMTGPLTGTPAPTAGRLEVLGKAAQTYPQESFTRSGIGGHWGPELKFAGFDGIVVEGKSPEPVYIWIKNGDVEIKDAGMLWGKNTYETQKEIWEEYGPRARAMVIGPAGENLSRIASIMSDSGDSAGQGGFGGVMGSKNLKAIAVRGTGPVRIAKPKELLTEVAQLHRLFSRKEWEPDYNEFYFNIWGGRIGRGTTTEGLTDLMREEDVEIRNDGCFACPLQCRKTISAPGLPSGVMLCVQSNVYLTQAMKYAKFRPGYGKVNFEACKLVDLYGINSFEVYHMLPWLESLYKKEVLTEEGTGLPFGEMGSREFITELLRKMTYREGFGEVLADGVPRAAEKLGGEAFEDHKWDYPRAGRFGGYTEHWFYLDMYGPDPNYPNRGHQCFTQALLWAVESRDPLTSHDYQGQIWASQVIAGEWNEEAREMLKKPMNYAYGSEKAADFYTWEYKPETAKWVNIRTSLKDSYVVCDQAFPFIFNPNSSDHVGDTSIESRLYSLITGVEMTETESYTVGERIYTLERAIMAREGRTREDEVFNEPFYTSKDADGVSIDKEQFEAVKSRFYQIWGWDEETGFPTRSTLERLDLKYVADELENLGVLPE